jgi:hypothetical protein
MLAKDKVKSKAMTEDLIAQDFTTSNDKEDNSNDKEDNKASKIKNWAWGCSCVNTQFSAVKIIATLK